MQTANSNILSLFDSTNMASATCKTNAILLDQIYGLSISLVWTGSPVGTLTLEASNDIVTAGNTQPTNWDTITGSTLAITGADHVTYNINGSFYKYIRVKYTKTSGTGTITVAVMEIKGA